MKNGPRNYHPKNILLRERGEQKLWVTCIIFYYYVYAYMNGKCSKLQIYKLWMNWTNPTYFLQPFSGKYYNHKGEGIYTCTCCSAELFSSKTKYDSGSGWPSFYDALQSAESDGTATGVLRRNDVSHGMVRTEILCKNVSYCFKILVCCLPEV